MTTNVSVVKAVRRKIVDVRQKTHGAQQIHAIDRLALSFRLSFAFVAVPPGAAAAAVAVVAGVGVVVNCWVVLAIVVIAAGADVVARTNDAVVITTTALTIVSVLVTVTVMSSSGPGPGPDDFRPVTLSSPLLPPPPSLVTIDGSLTLIARLLFSDHKIHPRKGDKEKKNKTRRKKNLERKFLRFVDRYYCVGMQ